MEELLGLGMSLFNKMEINSICCLKQLFDRTMERAYQCLGKDGFRIPSKEKQE